MARKDNHKKISVYTTGLYDSFYSTRLPNKNCRHNKNSCWAIHNLWKAEEENKNWWRAMFESNEL